MAEYLMRKIGGSRFVVASAGTAPAGGVNPVARKVLEERYQIAPSEARSKSWEEFGGQDFDFVITLCDSSREVCPAWPGDPVVAHWSSLDPVLFEGTPEETERYFFQVAVVLKRRVELFCSLPFDKLDHLRLEKLTREVALTK
jgi:arsenate reductase